METIITYKIHEVASYINWVYFFHAWGFKKRFSAVADLHGCDACRASWVNTFPVEERAKATEAIQLFKEAQRMLNTLDNDYKGPGLPRLQDGESYSCFFKDSPSPATITETGVTCPSPDPQRVPIVPPGQGEKGSPT